jgi:hypothetical protein
MKGNSEGYQYLILKGKCIQHNQEVQNDRVNTKDLTGNLHSQFEEIRLKQFPQKVSNPIGEVNQCSVD